MVRGTIAPMIELGAGFDPNLTAEENIYLNGAILGYSKKFIQEKFKDIVDFAELWNFLELPIKNYSSGMRARLGFAIATIKKPDILIIDEVLAVGDAEFQKKAIGKMQDVSSSEGRTVLFVSHNMASIQQLCHHGILLKNGMVEMTGDVGDVVDY